jgi:hypothetical protein
MKIALLAILIALVLSGCLPVIQTVNSLDSKIGRPVKPDTGEYVITLVVEGKTKETKRFRLEEYYDAQPSLRGNYWSWRIQGETHDSRVKISTVDKEVGRVDFVLMSTDELKKRNPSDVRAFFLEVGETTYWPSRDETDLETFYSYDIKGNVTGQMKMRYSINIEFIPDVST